MSVRYAVYYAPDRSSALHEHVSLLFGRDALAGKSFAPLPPEGSSFSSKQWSSMVTDPAKYGLHATLKAPFELSSEWQETHATIQRLEETCHDIARRHAGIRTTPMELRRLSTGSGNFIALTPSCGNVSFSEANPDLAALEKDCVTSLEMFRAPLSESDIQRRGMVTEKEACYLKRYGYHRIFDLFRFHLTLTNSLSKPLADTAEKALRATLRPFIDKPLCVDSISLFRQQDRSSPFVEVARFHLGTNNPRTIV